MNQKSSKPNPIPPPGQYIIIACAILGIIAGSVAVVVGPIKGMIPGAFFGMGGAVLGVLIARPIALAVNRSRRPPPKDDARS